MYCQYFGQDWGSPDFNNENGTQRCHLVQTLEKLQKMAIKQLKTLLQLRFQMSKGMLGFKKANSSVFKLLVLKISKIYNYKPE